MRIEGAIYPLADASGFDRQAWCQFIANRPGFRLPAPRSSIHSLAKKKHSRRATTLRAWFKNGRDVGMVHWSQSEEALVNLSVEPSAMDLASEWAAAMHGEFRAYPLPPPGWWVKPLAANPDGPSERQAPSGDWAGQVAKSVL